MKAIVLFFMIIYFSNQEYSNSWYFFDKAGPDTVYFEVYRVSDTLIFFNNATHSYFIEELSPKESKNLNIIKKVNKVMHAPKKKINVFPIIPEVKLNFDIFSKPKYYSEFIWNFRVRAAYHTSIFNGINRYCKWDLYGTVEELGYYDDKGLKDGICIIFINDSTTMCRIYDSGKLIKEFDPPCFE